MNFFFSYRAFFGTCVYFSSFFYYIVASDTEKIFHSLLFTCIFWRKIECNYFQGHKMSIQSTKCNFMNSHDVFGHFWTLFWHFIIILKQIRARKSFKTTYSYVFFNEKLNATISRDQKLMFCSQNDVLSNFGPCGPCLARFLNVKKNFFSKVPLDIRKRRFHTFICILNFQNRFVGFSDRAICVLTENDPHI